LLEASTREEKTHVLLEVSTRDKQTQALLAASIREKIKVYLIEPTSGVEPDWDCSAGNCMAALPRWHLFKHQFRYIFNIYTY
jgi:hypothetical protein